MNGQCLPGVSVAHLAEQAMRVGAYDSLDMQIILTGLATSTVRVARRGVSYMSGRCRQTLAGRLMGLPCMPGMPIQAQPYHIVMAIGASAPDMIEASRQLSSRPKLYTIHASAVHIRRGMVAVVARIMTRGTV